MFGLPAYVILVVIFMEIALIVSNKHNFHAYIKTGAGIVLTVMSCAFIQLVTVSFDQSDSFMTYYKESSAHRNGGGLLGGTIAKLLCPAIGVLGTFVVISILIIICLVLITEKSFLHGVQRGSKKAYAAAKEDAKKRREQAAIRRADQEQKRETRQKQRIDQTVSGVSFNTELKKKKPDIQEMIAPVPAMPEPEPVREMEPLESMEPLELPFPDLPPEPLPERTPVMPQDEFIINRAKPLPETVETELEKNTGDGFKSKKRKRKNGYGIRSGRCGSSH